MSTTAAKTNETVKSRMSTRDIVLIGMFAALLAAFSQISLPMPTGVPITIQAFGVALVGVVLGWKRALFSTIVYILLGAVGLPVFANFQGGLRVITGLTGGYILAWPVMAALCGASIPVKSASAPVSLFFSIVLSVTCLLYTSVRLVTLYSKISCQPMFKDHRFIWSRLAMFWWYPETRNRPFSISRTFPAHRTGISPHSG